MAKSFSGFDEAGSVGAADVVLISQLSSTVTITATTLSAQASDNSFNDSGSGFVTAGFAVGDRVKVTGFTGNTANNIFSAKITVLAAGKMTIGGTDGDVIVDDAAGESVTISKWETKRATAQDIADLGSGGGVSATQTEFISGIIASPSNKDYRVALNLPYALTVTKMTTRSASGTCTLTGKINTTALGGTANSVSSTEQSQSHASSNAASAGDDIVLTVSSNSSCADLSFLIEFTRTLD